MPRAKRRWTCRDCDTPRTPETPISKRGYCPPCSTARMLAAWAQVSAQEGPVAQRQAEGMLRAAQRKLDQLGASQTA